MSRKHEKDEKMRRDALESDVSRRGFLKGAGATVAAVGIAGPTAVPAQDAAGNETVKVYGPGPVNLRLKINGSEYAVAVEPFMTLLDVLRDRLDLTGSKRVCNRGFCGACTVIIDKKTVNACCMLAVDAAGKEITTIEGISEPDDITPLQQAFVDCDALQCGFCTPGMVMSCTALLASNPKPSREQVAHGIAGNICRCGTYQNIFEAVDQASGQGGK